MTTSDSIEIVKQSRLFENLSEKNQEAILELQNFLMPRLVQVEKIFSDYTAHDYGHALRTYKNLIYLLEDTDIIETFEEEHCLVAILATLLHDIGMGPINDDEMIKTIDRNGPQFSEEEKKIMREKHHKRFKDWILDKKPDSEVRKVLGWVPESLLGPIAEVGCAHRIIPLEESSFETTLKFRGDVRFLGALLRLADQMDLSPKRVEYMGINWEVVKRIDSEVQQRAFVKSLADKDWFLKRENKTLVLQSKKIDLEKPIGLVLEALYELEEEIQITIEETRDVPWRGKLPLPRILDSGFIVKDQASEDHRLGADFQQVWSYLYESMYSMGMWPHIAIREAISNSLDACNLMPSDKREPKILVIYDDDKLVIQDNGAGMTLDIVENYLKILGSSYYRSLRYDKKYSHRKTKPSHIGTLGIGVFSYFLVSNHFDILTKSLEDVGYRVHFFKKFGITINYDFPSDFKHGTRVEIPLIKATLPFTNHKEFKSFIRRLFPRPRIPLDIVYSSEGTKNKDKIEVKEKRSKKIQRKKNRDSVMITDYYHNEQFRLGYDLQISYEVLKEISINEIEFIIRQFSHMIENLEVLEHILTILLMYEGMRLENEIYLHDIGPATFALLLFRDPGLRIWLGPNFIIDTNPMYFYVWVDFNSNAISLDLTKMNIAATTDNSVSKATSKLDSMCFDVCKSILSNKKISRISKEIIRYGILSWVGYKGEFPFYSSEDSWRELLVYPMIWRDVRTNEPISVEQIISEHFDDSIFFIHDQVLSQDLYDAFEKGTQVEILEESFSDMLNNDILSENAVFVASLAEWYSIDMILTILEESGLKSCYKLEK